MKFSLILGGSGDPLKYFFENWKLQILDLPDFLKIQKLYQLKFIWGSSWRIKNLIFSLCSKEMLWLRNRKYPHIWLELTRTGIPIRRMSPKRSHSRTSHALSVNRNCMGFFASGQKLPLDR